MRKNTGANLGLIALIVLACGGSGDTVKRELSDRRVSDACNGVDSLIFSNVEMSPEDGLPCSSFRRFW